MKQLLVAFALLFSISIVSVPVFAGHEEGNFGNEVAKTGHCIGRGLIKGVVVGALARAITGKSDSARAWGYGTTALVWGDCELSHGMQRTEYRRSAPDYGYGGYGSYNPGEEAAY